MWDYYFLIRYYIESFHLFSNSTSIVGEWFSEGIFDYYYYVMLRSFNTHKTGVSKKTFHLNNSFLDDLSKKSLYCSFDPPRISRHKFDISNGTLYYAIYRLNALLTNFQDSVLRRIIENKHFVKFNI